MTEQERADHVAAWQTFRELRDAVARGDDAWVRQNSQRIVDLIELGLAGQRALAVSPGERSAEVVSG